jgi:uncharacterized membrane protein YgcG
VSALIDKAAEAQKQQQAGRSSTRLDLHQRNHRRFQSAIQGLKQVLADEYQGRYFISNVGWFVPGVVLSALTLVVVAVTAAVYERNPVIPFLLVWLTGWSFGVFFLLRKVIQSWQAVGKGRKGVLGAAGSAGGAVFLSLFSIPFVIGEVAVIGVLTYMTSFWLLPILIVMGWLNVKFFHFLKQPTVEGRRVMDRIEGFAMYLGAGGAEMPATARKHQETPETFDQFLPYAVALDAEQEWGERFKPILERAATPEYRYHPHWYHGPAFGALGAGAFASRFCGSFSSALSSASTAPGSSSGSGGGGSSGGGGGGGGGGGW